MGEMADMHSDGLYSYRDLVDMVYGTLQREGLPLKALSLKELQREGEVMAGRDLIDFTPRKDFRGVLKIHAIETVEDYMNFNDGQGSCNTVFYEDDIEDVIERCRGYLGRPNQTSAGFVIFKAVAVVQLPPKKTEVLRFDEEYVDDNEE